MYVADECASTIAVALYVPARGHTSWEPTNNHLWCPTCARSPDPEAEPEFWELHDKKTGESVDHHEVLL